jgi:23S rRNA-/tRNA-specific pseudouridylate synthase
MSPDDLHYVRKPHGLPTTFGAQFSFLETCVEKKPERFQKQCAVWGIDDEYGLLNRLDNDTA